MKWTLLSLWLLGAGLYAAIAFSSSHSECTAPAQSAAAVIQDDPKQASRVGTESGTTDPAPATQETVPNDAVQVQGEKGHGRFNYYIGWLSFSRHCAAGGRCMGGDAKGSPGP